MMNLKGSGRGLSLRHYPGIRLERLRKTTKNYVRIAGLRADILTRELSNTNRSTTTFGFH
jgi:hypothetical protein